MASSPRARAAIVASGILLATPAAAQNPPPAPPAKQEPPAAPARPMSQQPESMTSRPTGRAPKRAGTQPWNHKAHPKGKRGRGPVEGAPIVGAPTFHRLDDGSTRIAVEVSAKVDVSEGRAQGRLSYRFKGAFVAERVNRLPLLTGYFPTPVDRAQLAQDGPDVDLVIDLRGATTPTFKVTETPRGIVLQIDFPRVEGADKNFEMAQESGSRERAKRRTQTQTLGGAGNANNNDEGK